MSRLEDLERRVHELYDTETEGRAEWAGWLADHHVFVVADYATELAEKYGADPELARAAALLHDIADSKMKRHDPTHEAESLRMARELMEAAGYDTEAVKLVVDDAIRFHSCHDGQRPESVEGQVLATADSLAHLKTDFYIFATWMLGDEGTPLPEVKAWVLKKLERDFTSKILFDDIREEVRPDYEMLKGLFAR